MQTVNSGSFRACLFSLFFSFFLVDVLSQQITVLKEFKAKGVEDLSVDRLGNFFLIFKNGMIRKYDQDGKLLASTKNKNGKPSLVEPWYHPSIFVYNRTQQEWIIYDRELKNPQVNRLDPSIAIEPYLVCPTNDNKLLVFDKADNSIKRVNRFTGELLFEFRIDPALFLKEPDLTFIREYQNMIFVLDKNSGILIYNNIGKLINRFGAKEIPSFGVYGEELFFIQDGKPVLVDLYSEKARKLSLEDSGGQLGITDNRIIEISKTGRVIIRTFTDYTKD